MMTHTFPFHPFLAVALVALALPAADPAAGEESDDRWDARFAPEGVTGAVRCLVADGSGGFYVGGDLVTAGGLPVGRLAHWDGSRWSALAAGVDGPVRALLAGESGFLLAGGDFDNAGETPASHVARWDGAAWTDFAPGLNAAVSALALGSGGDVFAGGDFTTAGGAAVSHLARWDGATWKSLGSGTDNGVLALAIAGDDLCVGGAFARTGGVPAARFGIWHLPTAAAAPIAAGSARARLEAPFPNPFNPRATLRYEIAERGPVRLAVYNLRGEHVVTLAEGEHAAGLHVVEWTGRDARGRSCPSGIYFAHLLSAEGAATRRLTLLR